MNVSSVKNLNGEVFSAVQDASLTNVVQTNSGNWQDITAYQSNSASYLTAHQDLSEYQTTAGMVAYYTTADANTLSSMLSGAIDYVSANAGDEFPVSADEAIQYVQTNSGTIDETVTSYKTNSSTYMVETNLEYNAVNEISAYNGSAIAQYGAEKQWLVHDDTLVHLSNSAQYALGCNVSALQRLMGIDETVLWEGDINENNLTGSLSEPISSFNKVKILTKINRSTPDAKQWFEFDTDREYYTMLGGLTDGSNTSAGAPFHGLVMVSLTGGNVKYVNGYQHYWNVTAAEHRMFASIYKVVGIGRKA